MEHEKGRQQEKGKEKKRGDMEDGSPLAGLRREYARRGAGLPGRVDSSSVADGTAMLDRPLPSTGHATRPMAWISGAGWERSIWR